ncbi:MAG: S9 family peptidase [Acidimicrobiia bacterium]
MSAPSPKRVPHVHHRPTGDRVDDYHWLSDRDDPDTVAHLDAENAHADEWFATHEGLVNELFDEIKSRIQETDQSVPTRKDGWWYVTRTEEGRDYPIHCRHRDRERLLDPVHDDESILLDENREAVGHDYFSLGVFDVSPDGRRLAWSLDVDGGEHFTMRVRDLDTGVDLDDRIPDTSWAGTAWSADSRHLFYVTYDEQERPSTVWRHRVGDDHRNDVRVFHEPDERFYVGVDLTRSGRWIVIDSESKTSSETLLIPADDPTHAPAVVTPRRDDIEYHLDHWGDRFVVLTNLDAVDFRVMYATETDPAAWSPLIAAETGRRITRVDCFATHLVVHEWHRAQPRLRVMHRDGTWTPIDLGDAPHDCELDSNPEWETRTLRFSAESMVTPATLYEQDLFSGERVTLKTTATPNIDLDRYVTERAWARSADGTEVPYDLVRLAGAPADGSAPCLVYAYGSYEASMPPWFSVARLGLVDRGFTWVLAHPRGGGEMGRQWYLDGKLTNKRNTFADVDAVARDVVATGRASACRLAVRGGSAGGLMVGACINLSPELWAAAVAEVPFVDVVTTMSDPSLPLTVTEWEEWGDPRREPFATYMSSYSPYDNLVPRAYPAIFATAGLNDPRVAYHEPAKWIARIREVRTNDAPLLLRTEMGAGHGGPSGRYDRWREEATINAFVVITTG